jgi:hypothetical protein
MRVLKWMLIVASVLVTARYSSIYYQASEFNHFVQQEAQRTRFKQELQQEILYKAKVYALPVSEDNITITTAGAVISVAVNYQVPLNLLIFRHELKFRTTGSGMMR